VGIDTASVECDLALEVIQKMRYEGESLSWNWDKHCAKFLQHKHNMEEWSMAGMATHMSDKDQISASFKTISKDCKNSGLIITKGIIDGD
jgi:hypothetical protein